MPYTSAQTDVFSHHACPTAESCFFVVAVGERRVGTSKEQDDKEGKSKLLVFCIIIIEVSAKQIALVRVIRTEESICKKKKG